MNSSSEVAVIVLVLGASWGFVRLLDDVQKGVMKLYSWIRCWLLFRSVEKQWSEENQE